MNIEKQNPLKWPEGWQRTRIADRKKQGAWKKSFSQYVDAVAKELGRMGATEVLFTYNEAPSSRIDPGVAVYFSKVSRENFDWQEALGIDSPAPTLDEIDTAYKSLALQCHPDRGPESERANRTEKFKLIGQHRANARAWVLGTHKSEHEYVIPIDQYDDTRLNLAAIRTTIQCFRTLERVGAPAVLEATFKGFKTALPAHAEKGA